MPVPAGWVPEVVQMRATDALGRHGEQLAADLLIESGLTIIDRNWRCRAGEIDIVAADGAVLVICEVKTRTGSVFGTPLEAISRAKAARLRRLAIAWVTSHGVFFEQIRIDAIGILRAADGTFSLEHVRGVA